MSDQDDIAWFKAMIAEGEASGFIDAELEDILEKIIAQRLETGRPND